MASQEGFVEVAVVMLYDVVEVELELKLTTMEWKLFVELEVGLATMESMLREFVDLALRLTAIVMAATLYESL
jgi:hypothetical protein